MHPHAELIDRLYRSLAAHDHVEMAKCYHENATFEDIAFRRKGKQEIQDMWSFVTRDGLGGPDLKATFEIIRADDNGVHARLIDDYIFTETRRPIVNFIVSFFRFHQDGRIIEHRDVCDPIMWANMAMTGPKAWLAGRFHFVRSLAAKKKLREFLELEAAKSASKK